MCERQALPKELTFPCDDRERCCAVAAGTCQHGAALNQALEAQGPHAEIFITPRHSLSDKPDSLAPGLEPWNRRRSPLLDWPASSTTCVQRERVIGTCRTT
jgi:hypothetical protein